jgi:hypothetical protein
MGDDSHVANLTTTRQQDAVRLLVLLHVCGTRPAPDPPRADAVAAILAESRVQALDFWLCNPDYLALELLELHARAPDSSLVSAAELLVDDQERHFPTLRHFFGAYSELDGALNLLRCYGLAWDGRGAADALSPGVVPRALRTGRLSLSPRTNKAARRLRLPLRRSGSRDHGADGTRSRADRRSVRMGHDTPRRSAHGAVTAARSTCGVGISRLRSEPQGSSRDGTMRDMGGRRRVQATWRVDGGGAAGWWASRFA